MSLIKLTKDQAMKMNKSLAESAQLASCIAILDYGNSQCEEMKRLKIELEDANELKRAAFLKMFEIQKDE
jgi:hypothetical protein